MAPDTLMSLCLWDNVETTKVLKSRPLLKANTRAYCQQNQSSSKIKPQSQSSLTASPSLLPSLERVCWEAVGVKGKPVFYRRLPAYSASCLWSRYFFLSTARRACLFISASSAITFLSLYSNCWYRSLIDSPKWKNEDIYIKQPTAGLTCTESAGIPGERRQDAKCWSGTSRRMKGDVNSFQAKRLPSLMECRLLIPSSGVWIDSSYLLCTGRGFWRRVQHRVSFMQGMGGKWLISRSQFP